MRRKTVTTEQFGRRIWLIRVKTVATIVIKSQWRISMLAKAMIEKLNEQINLEFYSSNLYLQMSAWCEDKGFEG
ncbi:ferritin-like domain-containing protein, partial [Klebsiella pneumoniae]